MERTSTRFIPFLRKSHFAGAPISLNNLDLDLKPFHFPAPDNVFQSEPGDADSLYHLKERMRQHHPLVIHHLSKGRAMSALIHIQGSPWAPGWCWGPSPQWTPARRTSRCKRQCLQQYYWQMLVSIKPPPAAFDESGCSIRSQIHFWYLNIDLCLYQGSKLYNCHLPRQLSLNFSGASSCMSTHWASISWAFGQCQDVRWK